MTAGDLPVPPSVLFDYPATAAFGRILPKTKIYAHGRPTRRIKDLITSELAQIVWQHKLAPATLNLPARAGVHEIQVFRLELKPHAVSAGGELSEDVLRCIDKAIPSPIIFELVAGDRVRSVAAYKRSSDAAPGKHAPAQWVVGDYVATGWLPADTPRTPLPVALDMAGLYEQLLRQLLPFPARPGESLRDQTQRHSTILAQRREYLRLQAQLRREKQFNRKVAINAELRTLTEQLDRLIAAQP